MGTGWTLRERLYIWKYDQEQMILRTIYVMWKGYRLRDKYQHREKSVTSNILFLNNLAMGKGMKQDEAYADNYSKKGLGTQFILLLLMYENSNNTTLKTYRLPTCVTGTWLFLSRSASTFDRSSSRLTLVTPANRQNSTTHSPTALLCEKYFVLKFLTLICQTYYCNYNG